MNPPSLGSGGFQAAENPHRVAPPFQAATPFETTLDDALAELNALQTPEGVDEALFMELKDALRKAFIHQVESRLSSRGHVGDDSGLESPDSTVGGTAVAKFVSTPPSGSANQVNDLSFSNRGDGTYDLTWRYRNTGDYNQDGRVDISDCSQIAIHFQEAVQHPYSIQGVIDTSGNFEVDISDITCIAMNFLVDLGDYVVERAPTAGGAWTEVAVAGIEEATGAGRLEFTAMVTPTPGHFFYRVVPRDQQGTRGIESAVAELQGTAPAIVSVEPQTGSPGEVVEFIPTVTGTTPLSCSWDFGGGATPNITEEVSPAVELGSADEYQVSLTVSNLFGEDTYDFTLVVESVVQYDEVEDNDSAGEANELPALDFTGFTGSLGPGGYDGDANDYYCFAISEQGTVELTMTFDSGLGNLGLDLLDTDGATVLDTSNAAGDVEYISYELAATGTYYLRCFAESGNSGYTLDGTFKGQGPTIPHVLFVTPQVVEQNVETELTAITTGLPTSYSWSFGPGAVPPVSLDEQPLVTFGITGVCECSLTVTNALGDDTCDFVVFVPAEASQSNSVILIPSRTQVNVGDIIGVTVYAWDIAYPLAYLESCMFTYGAELVPVEDSENLGAPGGERDDKDGFWTAMLDGVLWDVMMATNISANVSSLGFPPTGVPAGTSGALFNLLFTAESTGTASLQFVHEDTYYLEPNFTKHFFDLEINADVPIS